MKNSFLYILTVLVWGSTWLAIEYQLGEVSIDVSLIYRIALAGLVMWAYCWWFKVPLSFSKRDHAYIGLLAILNFSINYLLIYWSQEYLTSAMTSIAFSSMLLMNIINTSLFFGHKIKPRVYIGALLGIIGIVLLFYDDLVKQASTDSSLFGLALVLGAALSASLGNMVSIRNSKHGMNILAVNTWGLLYATIVLLAIALLSGSEFAIPSKPSYLYSLLYLSVFGTVIAFATYYLLLRDIGPEKASYTIVLFPIVSVVLSSLFEGLVLSNNMLIGVGFVLLGNLVLLTPVDRVFGFFRR